MGTLLLLLLIFFVIIPLVKIGWRVWQFNSHIHRVQRDMRRAAEAAAGGQRQSGQAPPQPRPATRRKKIDPAMGEYVAFEEVAGARTTPADKPQTPPRPESQVEDADWEDIR